MAKCRVKAKFHYTDTDTDPHGPNGVSPQKSPCPCRARVRIRVVEFSYYRERVDSGGKRQRRVPVAAVDPPARARRLAEMRINSGGCSARARVTGRAAA